MSDAEPTWIVLVRDVSSSVDVEDEPVVIASLILDADTGLIRGVSMGKTAQEACSAAAHTALTTPAGPLPPHPPVRVVHDEGFGPELRSALEQLLPDSAATALIEHPPPAEAEDIFDSLLGHLAGRTQPVESPDPGSWHDLFTQAAAYTRAQPWQLWSDVDQLDLTVTVDGEATRYVAVVLGQDGVQRGLALYPGTSLPEGLADWNPGEPVPLPDGSLALWLDPPEELPADLRAKAARYGWPEDLEFAPILADITPDGLSDLALRPAQHLTLGLAAVVTHIRPRAVQTGSPDTHQRTTGTLPLSDGLVGEFAIG